VDEVGIVTDDMPVGLEDRREAGADVQRRLRHGDAGQRVARGPSKVALRCWPGIAECRADGAARGAFGVENVQILKK
jgi:hypothetical protein